MAFVIIRPTSDAGGGGPGAFAPTPSSPATFYDKVNEVVADDGTTYFSQSDVDMAYRDFGMGDVTGHTEPITKITVHMRVECLATSGGPFTMTYKSRINGTDHPTALTLTTGTAWTNRSQDWLVNPLTGVAWTWTNINSLVVGFKSQGSNNKCAQYLSQIYVTVEYEAPLTMVQGCVIQGCIIS